MKIYEYPQSELLLELLQRPSLEKADLGTFIEEVFTSIKSGGDNALMEISSRFNDANLSTFLVSKEEISEAILKVDDELKAAIDVAYNNIYKFHEIQKSPIEKVETMPGVVCWRKSVAIEKVGLYIPGGTAPLFSTVLMLGIPAIIAGCAVKIMCTPPNLEGKIHPAILYTASKLGISKVYKVGGAQAIAAMTFGTETIPCVYKIFGPGNQYVTAAKQFCLNFGVAIDMPAGPSEVMVVADNSADPTFIASDLLSQAEHGVDSQVIFVTDSLDLAKNVENELNTQITRLPRKDLALGALNNSKTIIVNKESFIDIINEYAPEHLILCTTSNEEICNKIINAGSVFLGNYTPESAGDYASGTNHTLPTNGYAKQYSGVSVDSFVKKITFQEISKTGLKNIGKSIEIMAKNEELEAHKNAVTIRLNTLV